MQFAFRWHARPSAHAHPAAAASTRANQVDEADSYNDQINERLQEEDGAMREEYVKWRKHDLPRIARAVKKRERRQRGRGSGHGRDHRRTSGECEPRPVQRGRAGPDAIRGGDRTRDGGRGGGRGDGVDYFVPIHLEPATKRAS